MSGEGPLAAYRAAVLRWNASINLMSRKNTAETLDALLDQCDAALAAWRTAGAPLAIDPAGRRTLYLDIGTGGGLPAVVWHERLAGVCAELRTVLVEPRDKRAWFLERVVREATAPAPEVLACRWGDAEATTPTTPELVLVSLKALRMPDAEVLAGVAPFLAPATAAELAIARFHPGDQAWNRDLVATLGLPAPGDVPAGAEWGAEALATGLVAAGAASLVISRYRFLRR